MAIIENQKIQAEASAVVDKSKISTENQKIKAEASTVVDKSKIPTDKAKIATDKGKTATENAKDVTNTAKDITNKAKAAFDNGKTAADKAKTVTDKGKTGNLHDLRHCTITDSCMGPNCGGLTQVEEAYRATGHMLHYTEVTQVDGITRLKYRFSDRVEVDEHSALANSIVKNGTSVRRSKVKTSLLQDGSVVWRSAVSGSTVSHSQLCRATLTDCDVEECVISRSNFAGVTLKYGVWKNGRFVRGVDAREPVAIASDGTVLDIHSVLSVPVPRPGKK